MDAGLGIIGVFLRKKVFAPILPMGMADDSSAA